MLPGTPPLAGDDTEKAQSLDDPVVEIYELGLGRLVNIDLHSSAKDESRAGAIERRFGQRIRALRGTVQALRFLCPSPMSVTVGRADQRISSEKCHFETFRT
jgi:hypothetical protein